MPLFSSASPSYVRRTLAIGLLLSLFALHTALAAATTDTEEQTRRARQEEQQRQQRQQQRDVFLEPQRHIGAEIKLPPEAVAFPIKTVQIEGQYLSQFTWLSTLAAQYNGRAIGQQGISLIVKRLNNALIRRGYITSRIVVPEQDLTQGVLHLVLIPGVISDIRFEPPTTRADWRGAFPTRPGKLLNLRDLEQGLEQLKRLPSQDADFQLVPGPQAGQSDVVITLKRTKPWRFIVSLDDSGNTATGRIQSSATLSVDNLLGRNDLFYLTGSRDAADQRSLYGTNGRSSCWSIPSGYWTYTLSTGYSSYKQTLYNSGDALVSSGNSQTIALKSEYLLQRDKNSKTSLHLSLQQYTSHSYLDDTEILVQRRKTSALEIGLSRRQYSGRDIWDYQLSYRHGMPWLGAQSAGGSDNEPTARYGIWTGEIDLVKPIHFISKNARYSLTLRGQYTNSTLYAADGFSIGNRYTVRGFDGNNTLIGERGFYWQNELAVPINAKGTEIYGGLDYGIVNGPSTAGLSGRQLIGGVIGLRGRVGSASYETFVGWPLKEPRRFSSGNPTLGFQMSYAI